MMILGLSVFQKKSFKGFNTFDLCDLEYVSRSFLFANFVRHHQRNILANYDDSRPFGISEEVV